MKLRQVSSYFAGWKKKPGQKKNNHHPKTKSKSYDTPIDSIIERFYSNTMFEYSLYYSMASIGNGEHAHEKAEQLAD